MKKKDWLLGIFLLGLLTRLIFLDDMAYKSDEAGFVRNLQELASHPYNPLTPISGHAGVAHSSGFFYLLYVLAFGHTDPISLVTAIAVFNVLILIIAGALSWNSKGRETLWMMTVLTAANWGAILHSKKIWTPELMVPWSVLCLVFAVLAFEKKRTPREQTGFMLASSFSLMMGGHMYLPGGLVGAIVGLSLWIILLSERRKRLAWGWFAGGALGVVTYLPWLIRVLSHAEGTWGKTAEGFPFGIEYISRVIRMFFALPSPMQVFFLYVKPDSRGIIEATSWGVGYLLLFFAWAGSALGWLLHLYSWYRIWILRKDVKRDPLVLSCVILSVGFPLGLIITRLGAPFHYWLSMLPFTLYLLVWAIGRSSERWIRLTWVFAGLHVAAALFFFLAVHQMGGLRGEYGKSYRNQISVGR